MKTPMIIATIALMSLGACSTVSGMGDDVSSLYGWVTGQPTGADGANDRDPTPAPVSTPVPVTAPTTDVPRTLNVDCNRGRPCIPVTIE